jgi:hypothetical protein
MAKNNGKKFLTYTLKMIIIEIVGNDIDSHFLSEGGVIVINDHRWLAVLLLLLLAFPNGALAYSYGDPNKDEVAETYKEIAGHLSGDKPDWKAAQAAYGVRRSEIASHFGEPIAVTLDQNFKVQNKDLLLANYKALLVMNLDRRFDYAKKDIQDYTKAKLLLAKAKGTFEVMRPYVEQKKPDAVQPILTAFEKALEAIGNPGLFGVGEKPVQPEEFYKQVDYIYATVKPLFPYTEAKAEAEVKETAKPKTDTTGTGTTSTSTTGSTTAPPPKKTDTTTSATTNNTKTTSSQTTEASNSDGKKANESSTAAEGSTASKSEATVGENTVSDSTSTDTGTNTTTVGTTTEKTAEVPTTETATGTSTGTSTSSSTTETAAAPTAAHAPMERSTKTNPLVSVGVIGSVILVGAGALWLARKQGWV